jgi:F-type H+-transporting ATPase subunit a
MSSPFQQFLIKPLVDIDIAGVNVSFTNSSLAMMIAIGGIFLLYYLPMKKASIIPSRWQSVGEMLYLFINNLLKDFVGEYSKKYFPMIFTTFLFVLFSNLLGMLPYSFTVTSHIIVTFVLGLIIFIIINIIAFYIHGIKFLKFFLPAGVPMWMAPMIILIELFTYISRPVSLSVRLAANMIAGHVMLKVLAGFVVPLGFALGWTPLPLTIILTGFEIFVAILQAYIFTILLCVYLSDAVNSH